MKNIFVKLILAMGSVFVLAGFIPLKSFAAKFEYQYAPLQVTTMYSDASGDLEPLSGEITAADLTATVGQFWSSPGAPVFRNKFGLNWNFPETFDLYAIMNSFLQQIKLSDALDRFEYQGRTTLMSNGKMVLGAKGWAPLKLPNTDSDCLSASSSTLIKSDTQMQVKFDIRFKNQGGLISCKNIFKTMNEGAQNDENGNNSMNRMFNVLSDNGLIDRVLFSHLSGITLQTKVTTVP